QRGPPRLENRLGKRSGPCLQPPAGQDKRISCKRSRFISPATRPFKTAAEHRSGSRRNYSSHWGKPNAHQEKRIGQFSDYTRRRPQSAPSIGLHAPIAAQIPPVHTV